MQKIIASLFIISCASEDRIRQTVYPNLYDGKYDSEFLYRSGSEQLEEISNTIRLLIVTERLQDFSNKKKIEL